MCPEAQSLKRANTFLPLPLWCGRVKNGWSPGAHRQDGAPLWEFPGGGVQGREKAKRPPGVSCKKKRASAAARGIFAARGACPSRKNMLMDIYEVQGAWPCSRRALPAGGRSVRCAPAYRAGAGRLPRTSCLPLGASFRIIKTPGSANRARGFPLFQNCFLLYCNFVIYLLPFLSQCLCQSPRRPGLWWGRPLSPRPERCHPAGSDGALPLWRPGRRPQGHPEC